MYLLVILFCKLLNFLSKLLHVGSGNTWPGHVALMLMPAVLCDKRLRPRNGCVLISGTNGKTTTTKLITHFLVKDGRSVVTNSSGANLLNGVATSLLLSTDVLGRQTKDLGVFEVDEFALPVAVEAVSPTVIVLLNLSRDQLDRYGETDLIVEKWQTALKKTKKDSVLILDCSQPEFKNLGNIFKGTVLYFDDNPVLQEYSKMKGTHNAKNINAAAETVGLYAVSKNKIKNYLQDFLPAWGRGEHISYKGVSFYVHLAKNPASFNQNLLTLKKTNQGSHSSCVFFILNDKIPDGRDVSWIYDVDPNLLKNYCLGKRIFVSGSRAFDMAARLNYAGVRVQENDVSERIADALTSVYASSTSVTVLPNYSAMLELRKILLGRNIL